MSGENYLIEVPEGTRAMRGGRYVSRGSWGDEIRCTDDPEQAVIMGHIGMHGFAQRIGLPRGAYTLVYARPVRAAHRNALREKRAVAQRVAEALATEIRRRFHGLGVFVGGKTKREVSVSLAGLQIAEFYVDLDAKVVRVGSGDEGGIENACWHLSERIAEIRLAADLAQA